MTWGNHVEGKFCELLVQLKADLDFFCFTTSEILGKQIWRKIHVNYDKFEMATKQQKSNI